MRLITWNVQWARGADGVVDPARIVRVCREMGDFDVLCFQEIARNFPGLAGSNGHDLFAQLAGLLPGYAAFEGIAVDGLAEGGERAQFGVLILTRRPVRQVFRHLLPWPGSPGQPTMQRIALELVIGGAGAPLRVTTTHLEYYSSAQRGAQIERLRVLQAEAVSHAEDVTAPDKEGGPFAAFPRPRSAILTGDFNLRPDDPLYARMQAPIAPDVPAYRDAWMLKRASEPRAPTVGLHDKAQWPGEPFCCDYVFVTEDLADRVEDVVVNRDTNGSDHQPVLLILAE
jgi:endonuclease/exonuclease/phosphatase family metal-dependent hydrolase